MTVITNFVLSKSFDHNVVLIADFACFVETHFISCRCTMLFPGYNRLSGSIPTEIGLLASLTYLKLGKSFDPKVMSIAYFAFFSIMSLSETLPGKLTCSVFSCLA
jgi:hypothetical protein